MSENSAKIQTETISSSKFPDQKYRNVPTRGFDADSDSELIMGSVFGLRGWNQDALGRLIPVSIGSSPFKPGVNTATCPYVSSEKFYLDADGRTKRKAKVPTIRDHSMAKCTCGYYAYFDDDTDDSRHGTVGGIVEGTGLAVIGEKGFRVEKAELKALIVRRSVSTAGRQRNGFGFWSWFAKWILPSNERLKKNKTFGRNADRGVAAGWLLALFIASTIASVSFLAASIITEVNNPISASALWPFLAVSLFTVFLAVSWLNIIDGFNIGDSDIYVASTRGGPSEVRLLKRDSNPDEGDPNDRHSVARLKTLYPGIPVFYSLRAAQKVFTLTSVADFVSPPADLPTPGTADNFWNLSDDKY